MKRTRKQRSSRSQRSRRSRTSNRPRLIQSKRRTKRKQGSAHLTKRRLGTILKRMKKGESLSASAKSAGLNIDEIRGVLKSAKVIQKRKGRWTLRDVPASMAIYTGGEVTTIIPADRRNRSVVGKYLNAVKQFRATNQSEVLQPFRRKTVRDVFGKRHALETDENTLYRLASSGSEAFEEIYKYLA